MVPLATFTAAAAQHAVHPDPPFVEVRPTIHVPRSVLLSRHHVITPSHNGHPVSGGCLYRDAVQIVREFGALITLSSAAKSDLLKRAHDEA